MFKWLKRILVTGAIVGVVGGICVGTGATSYIRSSGKMLKTAVKGSIPVEFEIQRARDLLEDLIPEMHANLRIVAAEEVEVANLEKDIHRSREAIALESDKVQRLRSTIKVQLASYDIGGREYKRADLVEELSRKFEHLRTAEMLLGGKAELLKNRRRSLDAALQKLEKTRMSRLELASQIEALEAQFRLVQAQSTQSEFRLDDSRLARTQKVIGDLKNRLEVAQRVLAREAQFVDMVPMETASESTVVERVDSYFSKKCAPGAHPASSLAVERQ